MNLSKNLTLAEMTRSEKAKSLKINNDPTPEHLENLKLWAENIFQPIRDHFGKPIYISSGYRSKALNNAIPGSSLTSQHCKGEAGDIDNDGTTISNSEIYNYVKDNLVFDQMIWEFGNDANPDWVHISYKKSGNRKEILRARKVKGKTVYSKIQ